MQGSQAASANHDGIPITILTTARVSLAVKLASEGFLFSGARARAAQARGPKSRQKALLDARGPEPLTIFYYQGDVQK